MAGKNLPYVESVLIDSKKEFSPVRPISKIKSVTSDHFPVIVTFRNLPPKKGGNKPKVDNFTIWNTNKAGGWTEYENLTKKDDLFLNILQDNETSTILQNVSPTEAMDKLDKVMTKVKHTAFGKVILGKVLPKKLKMKHH